MDHASHARSVCIKSEAANISPKVPDKRQHRTRTECPPRPIYRRRSCHHSAVSWSRSAQHCPPTHYQMHHTEPESAAKKKKHKTVSYSRALSCVLFIQHTAIVYYGCTSPNSDGTGIVEVSVLFGINAPKVLHAFHGIISQCATSEDKCQKSMISIHNKQENLTISFFYICLHCYTCHRI